MKNPTKEQILEAAAGSPEAKAVLEKLYPDYFSKFHTFATQCAQDAISMLEHVKSIESYHICVANGLAPNDELKMKSIRFSGNGAGKKVHVFNAAGIELFASETILLAFEK
jgi:hypothetical protein